MYFLDIMDILTCFHYFLGKIFENIIIYLLIYKRYLINVKYYFSIIDPKDELTLSAYHKFIY
jgi:hypothetical protein